MMERIFISKGEKVLYNSTLCIIVRIIDIDTLSIEEIKTNIIHTVKIAELESIKNFSVNNEKNLVSLSDKEWEKAQHRYNLISPILKNRGDYKLISSISKNNKISIPTIYRWVKIFETYGTVSSLAGKKKNGGQGKSRLPDDLENIIANKIHSVYLNQSKKSINKTIREVNLECDKYSIKPPHPNTIRNRIKNISDEEKVRKRLGIKEAKYKYEPHRGSFEGAQYPLSIVQIDHTLVDIILVDEQYRKPLKRPWLTLAIDVYSRMVTGLYLSFEHPGALGTGMCIANSILPKESWLNSLEISGEWSCWGIMDTVHLDNAKEFRGNTLRKSCANYGINIEFRPVATPHFGGHIERILGTFSKEIHNLPGTTFSNIQDRKNYDSKKNASFTLYEFEKWLVTYITKIYHKRIHSSLDITPEQKFKRGILGGSDVIGRGIPPRINNERKVRLDFMPIIKRTIQEYGIVIDHIHYYSDVLKSFIHDANIKGEKIQHLFRRDPRDISCIYFYDPQKNDYYDIPYRNMSLPKISIWEYREILKIIKSKKIKVDEKSIFEAYRELDEIEKRAMRNTKIQNSKSYSKNKIQTKLDEESLIQNEQENYKDIQPFDDIEVWNI